VKVRDSQCGYRAYPVGDFLQLGLRGTRYELEVEALVKSAWAGITIVDLPVAITYRPREGLVTSFRPFWDNARISRTYTRLFSRAMFLAPAVFRPRSGAASGIKSLSPLRPVQLIRAVLTESSSPVELGSAAAVGLFLATLPLPGLHTMAVVFAATLLRLNRLLAFSVSHLCAPPVVPAVCVMVGYYVRHGHWLSTFNAETLFRQIDQRFFDYLLGTVVVAPVLAVTGGLATAAIAWSVRRATSDPSSSFRRVRGRLAVYGSRWGLGFFRLVLRVGGIWPAYAALWFVVPYYLIFRPALRRSMIPYLSRRFPGDGRIRRFARSAMWLMAFSRTLVEQGAVRVCGRDYFDVTVRNQAKLLEIARSGRGIVLLMSHIGPWMVVLHYLRIMQRRVHLLIVREFEGLPVLAVEDPEESRRFSMIDTGKSMGGLIEATSALLKGDMVAIMGDRPWGGRTVDASFLGEDCRVLRTPYKLARATGSRVVMLLAHRTGYRKFERATGGCAAGRGGDRREAGQRLSVALGRVFRTGTIPMVRFLRFLECCRAGEGSGRERREGHSSGWSTDLT
jgi:predicted LPLAT superfamily acyltransferase